MEKLGYLWDEFNIFGKKGISLQVFDAEEDLESDPRPSQNQEFLPKTTERQVAGIDRGESKNKAARVIGSRMV